MFVPRMNSSSSFTLMTQTLRWFFPRPLEMCASIWCHRPQPKARVDDRAKHHVTSAPSHPATSSNRLTISNANTYINNNRYSNWSQWIKDRTRQLKNKTHIITNGWKQFYDIIHCNSKKLFVNFWRSHTKLQYVVVCF